MNDTELTRGEVRKLCDEICPMCDKGPILEGPSGGAATNLMCKACGAQFNFGGLISFYQGKDPSRAPLFTKVWDGN